MKRIVTILIIAVLAIVAGLAGGLDFDEYIEVNSTPIPRIINK